MREKSDRCSCCFLTRSVRGRTPLCALDNNQNQNRIEADLEDHRKGTTKRKMDLAPFARMVSYSRARNQGGGVELRTRLLLPGGHQAYLWTFRNRRAQHIRCVRFRAKPSEPDVMVKWSRLNAIHFEAFGSARICEPIGYAGGVHLVDWLSRGTDGYRILSSLKSCAKDRVCFAGVDTDEDLAENPRENLHSSGVVEKTKFLKGYSESTCSVEWSHVN